jgi:16S rRNA (guanine527-N7)-methyltransferase
MAMTDPAIDLEVSSDLRLALLESQRLGLLGDRKIDEVVAHARAFVVALRDVTGRVIDMGAGGGVPGLIIAHDRPDLHVTMVDRRSKRTDFVERMVRRLRWTDRVAVVHADVEDIIRHGERLYDAVVARGFGPPAQTLALGSQLVAPGGLVIISEPPAGDRWDTGQLKALGLRRLPVGDGRVVVFVNDG